MLLFEKLEAEFNYIDIGARGSLSAPWSTYLSSKTKLIGFEPDPVEYKSLVEKDKKNLYFPLGVWSNREQITFHLNEDEYSSSMYEPNSKYISKYENQHWKKRVPKKSFAVECDTLDNLLPSKNISPDFIKIDTQGSEYKILQGAQQTLKKFAPLVLTETWFLEVYKGAETSDQVISLMRTLGYVPISYGLAAAWRYKNDKFAVRQSQRSLVGMDFLFMKETESILSSEISDENLLKLVCLLEIYGHRDISAFLIQESRLDENTKDSLLKSLARNERINNSTLFKISKIRNDTLRLFLKKIFNIYDFRVGLHY